MLEIKVYMYHTVEVKQQNYLIFSLYLQDEKIIRDYPDRQRLKGLFFRIHNETTVYHDFDQLDNRLVEILHERVRRWSGPI